VCDLAVVLDLRVRPRGKKRRERLLYTDCEPADEKELFLSPLVSRATLPRVGQRQSASYPSLLGCGTYDDLHEIGDSAGRERRGGGRRCWPREASHSVKKACPSVRVTEGGYEIHRRNLLRVEEERDIWC